MKNWKAIAAICLVFILGAAAGGMITAHVIHRRIQHFLQSGPQAVNELIVKRLSKRLELDPSQSEKLKVIVADTRDEMRSARRQIAPQVKVILSDSAKKIRGILKPEQEKNFDEVIANNKGRLDRFE